MKKSRKASKSRIPDRYFIATPAADGSGYSWTLVSALGDMLLKAEEMFGPRDLSYTVLGIEFAQDGGQVWTPGNCNHLIVQLNLNALGDRHDAYRQLAHECVHLLSPTGKRDANYLEEGLAVYFEQWFLCWCFGPGWWLGDINIPNYAEALEDAKQLLTYDADIIKKVRQKQPTISRIEAQDIIRSCPDVPPSLAEALTRSFY